MSTATPTGTSAYEDAAAAFRSEGFCVVPDLVDDDAVATGIERMDAVREGRYETGVTPLAVNWRPGDDPLRICKIDEPHYADLAIRRLVASPEIGRCAAALYRAEEIYVWAVQLLYKPTGGDTAASVGWHQDDDYWFDWWEGEVFTCWLALSDVTENAGPVRFVPGSHEWGFLGGGNFHDVDLSGRKEAYPVPEGKEWAEVPALIPPGGASFHHRRTIHGSGPNSSGRPRRGFAIHLRTEKATPKPGSAYHKATAEFGAPVDELRIDF